MVTILLFVFASVMFLLLLSTVACVFAYDIAAIKTEYEFKRHPFAKKFRRRPMVSIIIHATDSKVQLKSCIMSLKNNSYRKKEIIVIDGLKHTKVKRWLRGFTDKKKPELVIFRTKKAPEAATIAAAKRRATGDLIAVFNGDQLVDENVIAKSVWYLSADPKTDLLQLEHRLPAPQSLTGLVEIFNLRLAMLIKKQASWLGVFRSFEQKNILVRKQRLLDCEREKLPSRFVADIAVQSPSIDSPLVFLAVLSSGYKNYILGLFATLKTQPKNITNRLTTAMLLIFVVATCLLPLVITYFGYLALWLHQPTLMFLTWLIFGSLLLFAIWNDRFTSLSAKISRGLLLPVSFIIFYALSFLFLITAIALVVSSLANKLSLINVLPNTVIWMRRVDQKPASKSKAQSPRQSLRPRSSKD